MTVHERVVRAILAGLVEGEDNESDARGADAESPENRSAPDVCRTSLAELASDAPLLRVVVHGVLSALDVRDSRRGGGHVWGLSGWVKLEHI